MLQLALRGVRHNTGRYIATMVAIITGVAFFTAAGFISDRVIDALEGDVDRQFGNVDVAVVMDTSDGSPGADFAEDLTIPGDALDAIADVDGVEAVAGELTGPVAFLAADGSTFGSSTGRLWVADGELNPVEVADGVPPEQAGEVAVDQGLADREDLAVGDPVTVLSVGGATEATVVGITRFGSTDAIDEGGTVSLPQATAFDQLTDGVAEYQLAYVRGSGDPAALTAAVAEVAPEGFTAQSGEDFRQDQRAEAGQFGSALKTALQGFALLALFVGAFVIYNTFSVIVAQRQRELAVLSAIGATPKQIKRSLRYEGLLVGLVGSALGVVTGFLLTYLLVFLLETFGVSLPGSGIVVRPDNVVNGLVLGTSITFTSVMVPARRASRTEPIEALREAAAETGALSRGRAIASAALVGLGVAATLLGGSPVAIGLGLVLLIVGVIVAGPFIAVGGAKVLRPVAARFGLEGRLAVDNTARNPKRTATTSNALLIGVFLVTFVTVAGTSLKDFVVAELQELEGADFVIASDGGSLDDELLAGLEGIDGVDQVTAFRRESVTVGGVPSQLSTADAGDLVTVADISTSAGSLDDLTEGTIAVVDQGGDDVVGSTVTVADSSGQSVDLEIVAVLEATIDETEVGNLVSVETFDALVGDTAPTVAFIDSTSGDQTDVQGRIEDQLATRPDITVTAGNALGQLLGSVFDFMINAVNGLLLMSVAVALIGIVNTLSLSILERRRELGLLRIVGMTDKRVQRMVRLESALIAALGTVSGMALGLAVGWGLIASIDRLSDADIPYGCPAARLGLVLVLGIGLGVLASLIPARRSTRLEVLDAIDAT